MTLPDLYEYIKNSTDIEDVEVFFQSIKNNDPKAFKTIIEQLKILYVECDDYDFLSSASILFGEFKIHSSAHLIVAKLLSGKFNDSGGTFLYSLFSLKKVFVKEELRVLWERDISWEMKYKLEMMNIFPVEN